jgi:hypothetical protein
METNPVKRIQEMIGPLPPELQQEVADYAPFLLEKKVHRKQTKRRLTWAGAFSEFRDQFTSLERQKKALEWRDD